MYHLLKWTHRPNSLLILYPLLCVEIAVALPYTTTTLRHGMAWQAKPRYATFEPEMLLVGRCCFSSLHFNLIEWDGLSLVTFTFSLSYTFSLVLYTTQHNTARSFTLAFKYSARLIIVFHTICPECTIFNLVLCDAPNFVCNSIYRMNWIGILYTHTHRRTHHTAHVAHTTAIRRFAFI